MKTKKNVTFSRFVWQITFFLKTQLCTQIWNKYLLYENLPSKKGLLYKDNFKNVNELKSISVLFFGSWLSRVLSQKMEPLCDIEKKT